MRPTPVILIFDLNNSLVDSIATILGATGRYTTINTYNERNAMAAIAQYDRGFGLLTNKLACVITGWNHHKKRREQFLFKLRAAERRSPFRHATPVVMVSEDHLLELKKIALDPGDGNVASYLHTETFKTEIAEILYKIVFDDKSHELNAIAYAKVLQEEG